MCSFRKSYELTESLQIYKALYFAYFYRGARNKPLPELLGLKALGMCIAISVPKLNLGIIYERKHYLITPVQAALRGITAP